MNPIGFNKRIINNAASAETPAVAAQVSAKTMDFVNRIFNSTTEVILDFLGTKTKQIKLRNSSDSLYCYENCLLVRSNGQRAYDLEQNIREIESIGIAPRFVKYFQLGEDDFLTVLETGEGKLSSYCENVQRVSQKAKQSFKTGVKELLDKGFTNKEIFSNKDAFLIDNSGKIVFADWTGLEYVSGTKKQALENHLKNWQF